MTTEALPTRAGAPTVLIVPGLRGDVAEHWQVHLQARLPGAVSVPTLGEHERLSCAAQVASLDAALVRITAPVILVAHSGGVITVPHWARTMREPSTVRCRSGEPRVGRKRVRPVRSRLWPFQK